jgi:hypothetical protein
MTKSRTQVWVRRAGLATGFTVAVIGLLGLRMPHGTGRLGLDLQMTAAQSGELQAQPLTPFLSATAMERGGSRAGAFSLRNETGTALAVRLRAVAQLRDADSSLHLRLSSGTDLLFDGPLGALRRASARALLVPRAGMRRVVVTASLPKSARGGFEGRIVDIQLAPVAGAAR